MEAAEVGVVGLFNVPASLFQLEKLEQHGRETEKLLEEAGDAAARLSGPT